MIDALIGNRAMTVPALWAARTAASPEAIFLRHQSGCWTYAEALRAIESVAAQLAQMRHHSGSFRVASYLGNTPETIWAWFGALRAGASYLALNRAHKGVLLGEMLARSHAEVLVTDREGLQDLKASDVILDMPLALISGTQLTSPGSRHRVAEASLPPISDDPYGEAVIIYTSGSTGRSKAVRLAHVALTHGATRVAHAWSMKATDVFHAWLPHFHIAGQLHQTMTTVVAGGSIALFPTFAANKFWEQVRSVGATIVIGLPNVINILWKKPADCNRDRTTLRLWLTTTIDPAVHLAFERRFGVRLLSEYGMTEAEQITLPTCGDVLPPRSCGRPGPDWEVAIVGDNDRVVTPGTVGQIVVRPKLPGILMLGYDGDDAATSDALRNAWFHCGDLGTMDQSGYLFFVDRRKHAIRRRGENVSSMELERVIEMHPAIACCAAVGVPSALGEDDIKVVVELRPEVEFSIPEFHRWCEGHMAKFMVPRFIEVAPTVPQTPVGKPDKERLRSLTGDEWDAQEQS